VTQRPLRVRDAGTPTVAIVGRPNVGKSTLVNRFTGRREAIVEEKPGVTRDRTAHPAEWRGREFDVVDTGGWTPGWARRPEALDEAISAQAEMATDAADVIVFVVDAQVGITEEDGAAAAWLRGTSRPVLLVANKVDALGGSAATAADLAPLYALGLGEPIPVSALHGRGSGDLLDEVVEALEASGAFEREADPADDIPGVALIGRPNVGKSSLFNRLLGEQRTIVDDRPGTTRDAVDTVLETPDGRSYRFVDTAGLRRKARLRQGEPTEYYSSVRTVQALDNASLALLVIDAAEPIGEQEQKLARQIVDSGRALVVVLNKWDLLDEYRREQLDRERDRLLGFIGWAPIVRTSAQTGRGLDKLLPLVDAALEEWYRRVPTAQLNDWLADAVAATPPPMHNGRNVRVRYATQVAVGPPTFRVFTTAELSPGYLRYLERRLRETFGFSGTPLDVGARVRTRWEERPGAPAPGKKRTPGKGGKGGKRAPRRG
jgi:GTPase